MKPSNLLCRWLPGWFKPGWRDCVHASCWSGPDAAVRLMNLLSPHCSDDSFGRWVDWMLGRGCETAHLFICNRRDGRWSGYSPYVADAGAPWAWQIDRAVCRLMRRRMRTLRRRGLAVVVWLFADDSAEWNRAAAMDFQRYLRDIGEAGLLDYASAVVAGLELDEYFSASQVSALVAAIRRVWRGRIGTHQTSGRYDFAGLGDFCCYQVSPGWTAGRIETEATRIRAATGKPLNFFELDRAENRPLCEAALRGGAFAVGNW